jgi:hypothetical protein
VSPDEPFVPTEDDFARFAEEAHANNRRSGLPAKAPTELRRKQPDGSVAVWTSMTPEGAKAWTDDMVHELGEILFAEYINSWETDNDRSLTILHKYFPDEYQRILEAIDDAREKVSTLRW